MSDTVSLEEHGRLVEEWTEGLVRAFGLEADIVVHEVDDETLEVHIDGDDLGLLIGRKGQTLQAIQSLSRTVVQRQTEGRPDGRVHIDVGGYRQRRKESLVGFAADLAGQVVESGTEKALEPMGAADRKIVHDAVNEIDGVDTISEGEEPHRRVVIIPAD